MLTLVSFLNLTAKVTYGGKAQRNHIEQSSSSNRPDAKNFFNQHISTKIRTSINLHNHDSLRL